MRRSPLLFLVVALAMLRSQAPTSAQKPLSFEVASIKPNNSGTTAMRIVWPRRRFSAVNVTTRQFVEAAYRLEPFRVEGAPAWLTERRFD